jgi:DNA-3-methyladenine glycosylase
MRFSRRFFERPAEVVARELLGARLHRVVGQTHLIGRIVETEAYDQTEAACHGYRGITERTAPLFGHAGMSYVYFTYGMHYCFNVVTGAHGHGAAVLIRALEPVEGIEVMRTRRTKAKSDRDLLSGPAKLCQAFDIARRENVIDLIGDETLYLTSGRLRSDETVQSSTRIGITQARELPWRFFIADSPFISKGKPS